MKQQIIIKTACIIFLLLNVVNCKNKQKEIYTQKLSPEEIIINNEDIIVVEENNYIHINKDNIINMPLEKILLNNEWYIGEDLIYKDHLIFLSNNDYIFNYSGADVHIRGKYEVMSDNNIKLLYPSEILKRIQVIEYLFQDRDELLLELQRNYVDFYRIGRLFSKELEISFYSSISSPENDEYVVNDIIVIKKTGTLKINRLLPTRLEPSTNAPLYQDRLDHILEEIGGYPSDWLNDSNAMLNVLFPGQIFNYDAISKQIDEIDGYSKPWYRLKIRNFSSPSYFYIWVYGGYIDELKVNVRFDSIQLARDYKKNLFNYLFDNGYIKDGITKEMIE